MIIQQTKVTGKKIRGEDVPEERRGSRRFNVTWEAAVQGTDRAGQGFKTQAAVENLSSSGAFLYMDYEPRIGESLDIWIRVPFKKENWMKYTARVVRIEGAAPRLGVGLKFNEMRPSFISQ